MSECKLCKKTLGPGGWEHHKVIKREPRPSVYFQTPERTWHLRAGGVEAYMINNELFCAACYEEKLANAT